MGRHDENAFACARNDFRPGWEMTLLQCYKTLGLTEGADGKQLHRAFKRLVLKYHPDRCGDDPVSRELFCQVTEAYATLKKMLAIRDLPDNTGFCSRCERLTELFRGLGGSKCCADCLLNKRRKLLPMTAIETIRCIGVIALQGFALYLMVCCVASGRWQQGLAAVLCGLAAMGLLAYHAWSADVIER
jgi:hypothetical protein